MKQMLERINALAKIIHQKMRTAGRTGWNHWRWDYSAEGVPEEKTSAKNAAETKNDAPETEEKTSAKNAADTNNDAPENVTEEKTSVKNAAETKNCCKDDAFLELNVNEKNVLK